MNKHLNKMFSAITILALMLMAFPVQSALAATIITQWSFESPNTPADVTDAAAYPNSIAPVLGSGNAGGFHASAATDWSSPAGNGSVDSFSSNNWAVGDYYQFTLNTLNFTGIQLSWDQNSSSTGPRDFKLAYSTDGTTFTDFDSYIVLASTWSSGAPVPASNITRDLSAITALDNQANVYFRLIDTSTTSANLGTVGTGGTNRVDNFTVSGTPIVVEVAPSVTGTTPTNGATNVAVNANIDVTFSEAVNANGSSFGITCGISGAHSYAVGGGPTTFTLDPDTDFANSETCTVTVVAAQVTDQDSNDPPNEMAADYIFSFTTVSAVDDAPSVSSTIPTNGATNVAVNANIDVTFSETINASGSSFDILCVTSGTHTAAVSGGSTTFTLNPDIDFANSETCTVTVFAAQISDQDANDPPDNMAADYEFSFTTVSAPIAAPLVINEIDYDQPSTDTAEFIEIKNVSGSAVDLDSYNILVVNGSSGGATIATTINLPSFSLVAGDYYVVCANAATVINCDLDVTPNTDLIQNGDPDAVALVQGTTVIDAVSYDGNTGTPYIEGSGVGVTDPGTTGSVNLGISRLPDGIDTNQNNVDFSTRCITPGETNSSSTSGCIVDGPPTVTSTNPLNGATGVSVSNNIDVNFSEAVTVSGNWFSISCVNSGAHTAAVSGGPQNYTLDPDVNFAFSESCSVTVVAASVVDQDGTPNNMTADYNFSFTTSAQPFVCGGPATFIHDIQGSGLASPLVGNVVTVEGVVVGSFQGVNQLGGFHIQEEGTDVDADPMTSEGIFVFNSSNTPAVGDVVRIQATVSEFNSLTELTSIGNFLNCSSGNVVTPATVTLPVTSVNDFEKYEGMLVTLPQTLVISEYFNYERFGELVLALPLTGESRAFTPTAIDEPGAPALARALANSLRRITLDDGLGSQNPVSLRHPNGNPFALDNAFRGGDTVQNVTGVMDYSFGLYRIQPTAPAAYTVVNPRSTAPEEVGGRLRVAAMNTLNFFITPDYPTGNPLDNKCGPLQSVECRGADFDQPLEFTRQRDKLLAALAGLDADVIGLNELENTLGVEPLGDPTNGIVAGLNATFGPGTYAYINTGVIGTDAIRVGLIYKPAMVAPVGDFKVLTSAVDPRFIDTKSRPALAQTFEELATGNRFTVVVNHLKSKGSDCNDVGDPDMGDGQGNCNQTRKLAAQALVDWLATDPTGSGDPDFIIMGDLNSYAQEDPIDAIKAGSDDTTGTSDDYTNLIFQYQGAYAYSYVFDGQAGYLDHALANSTLTAQVTGAADWHINSDEPDLLDYDTTFKPDEQDAIYEPNAYRSSDHDPVVIGLNLLPQCNGQNATVYVNHNGKIVGGPRNGQTYQGLLTGTNGNDVIVGTNNADTILALNGNDVVCSLGGSDTISGGTGNDTINSGSGNDTVFGNANNDVIDSGEGNDTAFGESGNDTINGGNGKDNLFGGDGLDVLDGGADKDVVEGGLGVDTLAGGSENDTILGGPGNDALNGGGGSDICNGGVGTDTSSSCETNILIP